MQRIAEAIYTQLTTDQTAGTVYDDLGGRIYFEYAPQEIAPGTPTPFPYLVFNVLSDLAERNFDGDNTQNVSVEFELIGDKALGTEALGDTNVTLFNLMNGTTFSATDHDRVTMVAQDRGTPSIEEDAYVISSLWLATAKEFV